MIEYLGSISGIGGILAFCFFLAYRDTTFRIREDRMFSEKRLTSLIDSYNEVCKGNQEVMIKHTQVMTELITYLKMRSELEDSRR